jgi:hypothetical protein
MQKFGVTSDFHRNDCRCPRVPHGARMKIDHNVAAVILAGLASGEFRMPRSMAWLNRLHSERAPRGSAEEAARIAAAETKRVRKAARGALQSSGGTEHG